MAVTAALVGAAAACGTVKDLTAGQKVDQAFDRLGQEHSLAFELDVDATPSRIQSLAAEADSSAEMSHQVAKLISDARISVAVRSSKPLEDSGEEDVTGAEMKIAVPDGALLEYRQVGGYLYYRADPRILGEVIGAPLPSADDLPPEAGPLKKVLKGEWVKIDRKKLEAARAESGKAGGAPDPQPSLDADTQQKVLKALRQVIAREVTFTSRGGEDGAEHITATAPVRTLLTELFDEIRPLTGDLPPGLAVPSREDLKDAPNSKVGADFTLTGGELTAVSVDLAKLSEYPTAGRRAPLILRIDEAGRITAPAGASELDPDQMPPGFPAPGMLPGPAGEQPIGEDPLAEDFTL